MKPTILILFCLLFIGPIHGQDQTVTFEQMDSLWKQEDRPLLVFIHTDWCKYCRNMETNTFEDSKIKEILDQDFYFISFDAEERRTIQFNGYPFPYQPKGANSGVHSLAEAIGTIDGTIQYPTLVVVNSQYELIFQYGGFLSADQLGPILEAVIQD